MFSCDRFYMAAYALAMAVSISVSQAEAQPAPPTLKVNAALVLTSEFCGSEMKRGNGWTSVKEDFPVGEKLCPILTEALSPIFASLRREYQVPDPNSSTADVILIPKIGDIGATQKTLAFSKRELVVIVEWTALDRAGKTLWVGTVEASAKRNMGNAFTHGKNMRKINDEVVADAVGKSVQAISTAPGLAGLVSTTEKP